MLVRNQFLKNSYKVLYACINYNVLYANNCEIIPTWKYF